MITDARGSTPIPAEQEAAYADLASRTRALFDLSMENQSGSHFFLTGYTDHGYQTREITIEIAGRPDPLVHIERLGTRGVTTIQLGKDMALRWGHLRWGNSSVSIDKTDARPISFDELTGLYGFFKLPDFSNDNAIRLMEDLEKLSTP